MFRDFRVQSILPSIRTMGFVEAGRQALRGKIHRLPASPLRATQLPYIQILILFGSKLLPESRLVSIELTNLIWWQQPSLPLEALYR
jgi:hypothetical protein